MSEDSEDIIKKLTEDVPDGKATFPADEDDEFNLLLDNFIQSELKNIEEEKNNTRIMLEEPEPQPIKQNASDDEVDRKSTRLNSSHIPLSRMPSSA